MASESNDDDPDILKQSSIDPDSDDEVEKKVGNKSKTFSKKSVFALLDIEDDDMDVDQNYSDSSEPEKRDSVVDVPEVTVDRTNENVNVKSATSDKANKKSKKKNRKKVDDDEDIDKIMAELELEYSGGKKSETVSNKENSVVKNESKISVEEVNQSETNAKPSDAVDTVDGAAKSLSIEKQDAVTPGEHESEATSAVVEGKSAEDAELLEYTGTVKTAAQKKKEKKEREKQKKLTHKTQVQFNAVN